MYLQIKIDLLTSHPHIASFSFLCPQGFQVHGALRCCICGLPHYSSIKVEVGGGGFRFINTEAHNEIREMTCCWKLSQKTVGDRAWRETTPFCPLTDASVLFFTLFCWVLLSSPSLCLSPSLSHSKIWLWSIYTIRVFIPFPQTNLKLETENVAL